MRVWKRVKSVYYQLILKWSIRKFHQKINWPKILWSREAAVAIVWKESSWFQLLLSHVLQGITNCDDLRATTSNHPGMNGIEVSFSAWSLLINYTSPLCRLSSSIWKNNSRISGLSWSWPHFLFDLTDEKKVATKTRDHFFGKFWRITAVWAADSGVISVLSIF